MHDDTILHMQRLGHGAIRHAHRTRLTQRAWFAWFALLLAFPLVAQTQYDVGASDTEIKIGNFVPYSGPVSAYSSAGRVHAAYFNKVNAEGGINGRRITFISVDDAYNPAQSVEQTRKLVERDGVLLMFGMLGTTHNQVIQRYLNQRKVPQLFIASGSERWGDYRNYPWTMGWQPTHAREGEVLAHDILKNHAQARIGILVQNDDFGRDALNGVLHGLGDKGRQMIVAQQTYEVSDPTVDSQLIMLKNSRTDVLINLSSPKFAMQAIRKLAEMDFKPVHYLSSISASIKSVLYPAGLENAQGIITFKYTIDPSDPRFKDSGQVREYRAFMQQYYPEGDPDDSINVTAYIRTLALVEVLKRCGDVLTRANVMRQAANLDMEIPMLLPGIRVKTAPDDFYPIKDVQLVRFEGENFVPLQ